MAEYCKLAYFGRTISTAFPLISSSRLRPDTTSPRPPALAAGAHSGATITTYIAHPPRHARSPDPPTLIFAPGSAKPHRPEGAKRTFMPGIRMTLDGNASA